MERMGAKRAAEGQNIYDDDDEDELHKML